MKKWIYISAVLYVNLLAGQGPFMLQLTDADGLPNQTIYKIIQDRQGYIWIGSAGGLTRYDGRNFEDIDLSKLLDKEIVFLEEDFLGRIWINNLSGEVAWIDNMRLNVPTFEGVPENTLPGRFTILDSTLILNYLKNIRRAITYDMNKDSSITKRATLYTVASTSILSQYSHNNSVYFENASYYKNCLCIFYFENDSIKKRCMDHTFQEYIDESIFILNEVDDEGRIIMNNKQALVRYDMINNSSEIIYDCSENRINGCTTKDGKIWVFTKNGVLVFDEKTFTQERVLLEGINSHNLFEDREKNLWISTSANGVYLIYNMNSQVYNSKNSDIPKSDVYSIYFDELDQSLFIGLSGGHISKLNVKTQKLSNYKLPLSGRLVTMEMDQHDRLWMGLDDGICVMNPTNGEIKNTLHSDAVKVLKVCSNNDMLCGTSGLVNTWNSSLDPKDIHKKDIILRKRTSSIEEDAEAQIWIGTTSGLYRFHDRYVIPFFEAQQDKMYSITDIEAAVDSTLWVATANEGILHITKDSILGQYTVADGLASNNCRSLLIHGKKLFIGSDNGLNILDRESNELFALTTRDGLPSPEINCIATDGFSIWMGTPKGLVSMQLENLLLELTSPAILLEHLYVNGEKQKLEKSCTLEYWQNTLDFEYVGIDIKSNQKESYVYRLKGLNNNWHSSSSQIARFHKLPAGDYTFEVKTVNDIGVKSKETADFEFSILLPWWKTIWFYLGSGLLITTSISSIAYWRINEKRKREQIENQLKERIQLLKSESLKSQMNPHFIYNSLNAIQDFFVTNDEESALIYLSKFAQMIRQIFDYSSRNVITLQEEIEFLSLYLDLEKLRFGDRIEIVFEIAEELKLDASDYEIPPLLLQPIIENTFKHGLMHKLEGGKVRISFVRDGDHIKCTIEDNGIGRKASNKMKTWRQKKRAYGGLQAVEERLSIWSNNSDKDTFKIIDLENSEGEPRGTRIIIKL